MSRLGYLAVALAAVLWAVGGTVARALIDRGASPVELTEARAWIAVAGTGALVAWRRSRTPPGVTGGRPPLGPLVAFGITLGAANLTYYLAISRLPVAVAIVIQYTAPALVVLWAAVVEGRRPSRRLTSALVLVVAGVALLAGLRLGGGPLSGWGLAAAAASSVTFAAYVVLGEGVGRRMGAERAVFSGFAVAGIGWLALQAVRGRPATLLDASFLPGIAFLGVVATILPFLLFVWGLGRVAASRAGIVSTLEPLTAAALAYWWLGQTLGPGQLAGAAMVVAGIAVVQSERPLPPETIV